MTHIADFVLWDPSKNSIQLQMFSSCQQLVDGVKLRTVTHVLMDLIDLPQDTAKTHRHTSGHCKQSHSETSCFLLTLSRKLKELLAAALCDGHFAAVDCFSVNLQFSDTNHFGFTGIFANIPEL